MRILIVEDDKKIASFVGTALRLAGFAVDQAGDGAWGLELALGTQYDAAIVDVMLPHLDGFALIEELRRRNLSTPIIVLSAKRSVDDRISGLRRGGDDYLTKPFSLAELLARVNALIRRSSRAAEASRLTVGDLSMDVFSREVHRGEQKIELQPREFALLEYLMRNCGRPVSKMMILERLWDYGFDPQTNVVDVLVCRLRGKIDRDFPVELIHTLRGVGYVLKNT